MHLRNTGCPGTDPLHPSAEAEQEALYYSIGGFLQTLLARKFEVPLDDAGLLVDEAFTAYDQLFLPPRDARAWIIGAACKNANHWRLSRGLPAGNEEEAARTAYTDLRYRDAIRDLPASFRKALQLRFEQKTYPEIAQELGISKRAAEHLVAAALARVRGVVRREGPVHRQPG